MSIPDPKTILVYTLGELLGDGMVKLPFVQQLRKIYPKAHITWMAGQRKTVFASILKPLIENDLNEVHELTKLGTDWKQWFTRPWKNPYDLIIDTQRRAKATLILKRVPHTHFISSAMKWAFSDIKPEDRAFRPAHFAAQHTMFLDLLSDHKATMDYTVAIPDDFMIMAKSIRQSCVGNSERWVLLAPGAGVRIKCWPLERFTKLAQTLRGQGVGVSYILGPQDLDMRDEITAMDKDATFPLQMASDGTHKDKAKSIYTTLALGDAADVCVANDAGVGHVFAATSTSLVSLFGIVDEAMWAPLTPRLHLLKGGAFDTSNAYVNAIPFEVVLGAVKTFLD